MKTANKIRTLSILLLTLTLCGCASSLIDSTMKQALHELGLEGKSWLTSPSALCELARWHSRKGLTGPAVALSSRGLGLDDLSPGDRKICLKTAGMAYLSMAQEEMVMDAAEAPVTTPGPIEDLTMGTFPLVHSEGQTKILARAYQALSLLEEYQRSLGEPDEEALEALDKARSLWMFISTNGLALLP